MVIGRFRRAKHVHLGCIALSLVAITVIALTVRSATQVEAKTPGSTYCYHGVCHRVKTIEETRALVGREHSLVASHYDDCKHDRYNPCGLTSSGERFHPDRPDNTASHIYPDGTTLLLWNPETERALVVRVNNAGPYHGNRQLDLSRAAAEKLGFEGKGVAKLYVKVVKAPEPEEAIYAKHRSYAPVPGDIGEYSSVEEAERGMAVAYALQASATSLLAPVTSSVFSTPGYKVLVAQAPQARGQALTRLAAVPKPETGFAADLDNRERYEASEPEPETIANAPVAEIDPAAVTQSVTAKEAQRQVAAANTADALKAQPVRKASSKKKRTPSARSSKRKKVASRRSQSRKKRAGRRGSSLRNERVRVASVRSRAPQRYKFHARSISESHHRHMQGASSRYN
ncbi:MAG: RlpA-like double-psi beta-barrel domain-containing protein [Hyphomicrobium sp.]